MLRISSALTLVNALFWSTQMMSHQDGHCGCHQNVTQWQFHWPGHGLPPMPTYLYTGCYTDWVWTVVNSISCPLVQSNGLLTCPFAGGVTAGVHSEVADIFITLRWMTNMTRMTRNLKSRLLEWLVEVYGNLGIVVVLVMGGVNGAVLLVALPFEDL